MQCLIYSACIAQRAMSRKIRSRKKEERNRHSEGQGRTDMQTAAVWIPKKTKKKSAHARLHSRKPRISTLKIEHLARETRKFPRCGDGKKGNCKVEGKREKRGSSSIIIQEKSFHAPQKIRRLNCFVTASCIMCDKLLVPTKFAKK